MLSNKEIILFSGGVDSAVLLKWLLINTNTDYLVIFLNHNNNNIQEKKADKLINIFKIKFRDFEYIKLKFNIKTDKRFDLMVDQVLLFLTGILCYERNIEKVWMGHFSYCSFHHYQFNNKIDNFWYNGELIPFIQSFSKASDSLLKTAYDYLDKEIQEKTRSCYTKNKNFCGTCYKCNQYKLFGIK